MEVSLVEEQSRVWKVTEKRLADMGSRVTAFCRLLALREHRRVGCAAAKKHTRSPAAATRRKDTRKAWLLDAVILRVTVREILVRKEELKLPGLS
jgi:hypothetical protein